MILITGHTGFVGSALKQRRGCIGFTSESGKSVNVLDLEAVTASLQMHKPDAVIHLAAQTFIPEAFANPRATYETNFLGTHNLLTALKKTGFGGRLLFVSSADVYGPVAEGALPAIEATPLKPLNPYAVSKIAAEALCRYWHDAEALDVIIARPFNHIGPGQSTRFALSDFSRTMIQIRNGKSEAVLPVGDLDVTRDFTDFRDVIEAYLLLLERGQSGETYNVCSGVERRLEDAVHDLARLAGVNVKLEIDASRFRKAGQRRAVGSAEKLRQTTGWQPAISWEQSLEDMLNYWNEILQ